MLSLIFEPDFPSGECFFLLFLFFSGLCFVLLVFLSLEYEFFLCFITTYADGYRWSVDS